MHRDDTLHQPLTDHAYFVGVKHRMLEQVGQDYALSGAVPGLSYGIVADGCSGAGRAERGARIWAESAERVLLRQGLAALQDETGLAGALVDEARPELSTLPFDDGFATLGLVAFDGKKALAALYGDGVVLLLRRNGTLAYWLLSCAREMPRYLNYELDPALLQEWTHDAGPESLRIYFNEYRLDSGLATAQGDAAPELLRSRVEVRDARLQPGWMLEVPDLANVQGLFVLTDGAVSFYEQTPAQSLLPLAAALEAERAAPGFVQAGMAPLKERWDSVLSAGPIDDLAVAGIWLP